MRWLLPLLCLTLSLNAIASTTPATSQQTVDKVLVLKSERKLHLQQRGETIKSYRISLGKQPNGAKQREGDLRTPEGFYWIDWRKPSDKYQLSLHISYPNASDTAQAKARGVSAGGDVMIHGSSNLPQGKPQQALYDYLPREDWTHGCVAVSNQDMDELWANVKNGTKIRIYP